MGVGKRLVVDGKVDTGAWRTSMDQKLATDLGLLSVNNVLWTRKVRTTKGVEERPVIYLRFYLPAQAGRGGKLIKTYASVTNRAHMRVPVIIGRRDLVGFVVKSIEPVQLPGKREKKE